LTTPGTGDGSPEVVLTWTPDPPNTTGPTVSNVNVTLPEGGQLGSSSIQVSWSASDDETSANDLVFHIQRRVVTPYGSGNWNNGAIVTDDSIVYRVALWKRFQYRVRARDLAGNWGEWTESYPATFLARRAEKHFTRDANWLKVNVPGAANGKIIRSSVPGAVAEFAFTGNGVTLVTPAGAGLGEVQVCLDPGTASETCKMVNLASFTPSGQRRYVASFAAAWGSHVLRMTVVSGTVDLDGAVFSR
jgi:hypothetical protein